MAKHIVALRITIAGSTGPYPNTRAGGGGAPRKSTTIAYSTPAACGIAWEKVLPATIVPADTCRSRTGTRDGQNASCSATTTTKVGRKISRQDCTLVWPRLRGIPTWPALLRVGARISPHHLGFCALLLNRRYRASLCLRFQLVAVAID